MPVCDAEHSDDQGEYEQPHGVALVFTTIVSDR
jgi:hypothetical protein